MEIFEVMNENWLTNEIFLPRRMMSGKKSSVQGIRNGPRCHIPPLSLLVERNKNCNN